MTDKNADVTADQAVTRAILELLPAGGAGRAYGILKHRLSAKMAMSEAEIYKAVSTARLDQLIKYCGSGDLRITTMGVERLQGLIHHDMTRATKLVADAALADILAEMGLPA